MTKQTSKEKGLNMTNEQQIINKIKDWLKSIEGYNEPFMDNLEDIDKGWLECSQMLLEQIEKWEKQ